MIKKFLHFFRKHDWKLWDNNFRQYFRECAICYRCEIRMNDGSWFRAFGTEHQRSIERKDLEERDEWNG